MNNSIQRIFRDSSMNLNLFIEKTKLHFDSVMKDRGLAKIFDQSDKISNKRSKKSKAAKDTKHSL